jgi:hypothetical protein
VAAEELRAFAQAIVDRFGRCDIIMCRSQRRSKGAAIACIDQSRLEAALVATRIGANGSTAFRPTEDQ